MVPPQGIGFVGLVTRVGASLTPGCNVSPPLGLWFCLASSAQWGFTPLLIGGWPWTVTKRSMRRIILLMTVGLLLAGAGCAPYRGGTSGPPYQYGTGADT